MEKRKRVVSSKFCWVVFLSMIVAIALVLNGPLADAKAKEKKMVDLNTASQKELEGLKGVGAATAKKIIAARPYKSVDDLSKAGLTPKQIENLKPFVTIGAAASTAPAATAKETTPKKETTTKKEAAATKESKPAKAAATTKLAPGEKVNINTASKEKLEALPDIGPVRAQGIIDGRPYKSIEEIKKVKGIGDKIFEKIKGMITI